MIMRAERRTACRGIDLTAAGGQVVVAVAQAMRRGDGSSAARRLAARAVATLRPDLAGHARIATGMPSGRPTVIHGGQVVPVSVSLAHVTEVDAACASTTHTVGIDVVSLAAAEGSTRDDGLRWWFTRAERRLLAERDVSPRAVWAAKEAAYKAAQVDVPFRPRLVEIEWRGDASWAWRLRDRWHTVAGDVQLIAFAGHVIAIGLKKE